MNGLHQTTKMAQSKPRPKANWESEARLADDCHPIWLTYFDKKTNISLQSRWHIQKASAAVISAEGDFRKFWRRGDGNKWTLKTVFSCKKTCMFFLQLCVDPLHKIPFKLTFIVVTWSRKKNYI